jgi:hypothetical protein
MKGGRWQIHAKGAAAANLNRDSPLTFALLLSPRSSDCQT